MVQMDFLFHYLKWINKHMFKSLNWITNNYFLKQKLIVPNLTLQLENLLTLGRVIQKMGKKCLWDKQIQKLLWILINSDFLRDLKSEGSIRARSIARTLVEGWIDEDYNLLSKEYSVEAMVSRITTWSFNYSWFAESGQTSFKKKLLYSIALQCKYLEIKLLETNNHIKTIIIIKGIIVGKSILYQETDYILNLLQLLDKQLQFLLNQDGGHKSRSPVLQIELLRHLIEIRSVVAILKTLMLLI